MNRKGGPRRKSRQKMSKKPGERGKLRIKAILQSFKEGDKVQLVADPSYQKGLFHLRFYGTKGIVKSKKGNSYYVDIKDGNKEKSLIVHPVHLKKLWLWRQ